MRVGIHRFALGAPDDLSALRAALAAGAVRAEQIVALIGKLEGEVSRGGWRRVWAPCSLSADGVEEATHDDEECPGKSEEEQGAMA